MFTEHYILQGSSSPSHTAGECHGFSVDNISFNKASTEPHRKWQISIHTASLVVHIPAAVDTIDSRPQSTYLQHHTGLTASTITAATSPMFGFPVLCSCCWGDPKPLSKAQSSSHTSCGAIAHNLWVILAQYSRRLEGVDQNLSRRCITYRVLSDTGSSHRDLWELLACLQSELKVIVLSSFTHPHNVPNMILSLPWNENGKIYLDNRTMEAQKHQKRAK